MSEKNLLKSLSNVSIFFSLQIQYYFILFKNWSSFRVVLLVIDSTLSGSIVDYWGTVFPKSFVRGRQYLLIKLSLYRDEWNNHQEKKKSRELGQISRWISNTRKLPYRNIHPPTNWITFLLNKRRSSNDFETIDPFDSFTVFTGESTELVPRCRLNTASISSACARNNKWSRRA